MPTIAIKNGQRQRIESITPETLTPYWTRVLHMARGRYHRGEHPFSVAAQKRASNLRFIVADVAEATGTHHTRLWENERFIIHIAKFQHYINGEPNAFAARNCLKNAERAAFTI